MRDALNRVVEETDPLNNTSYVDYDLDDNVTSVTDRLGRVRSLSYDANGRQVGESWLNGTVTVDALLFDYDDAGNLLSAGDSSATYDYEYDQLNRVTNVSGPFGVTLMHSYDAVGNRTRTEDSFGGVITSTYNDANLLSMRQFSDGASTLRFDQTYNDRNQLEEVTRYSDLAGTTKVGESDYAYDDQGRLENINHKNGSDTTLAELTYTYDALNRVKTEVLDGTTKTFTYDERSQLLDDSVTSYSYDDNGNRDMAGYQTTTGNRMTNDGTFTYTYDAEGNTIKKSKGASLETWVYEYDFRNQLIDIEKQETDGGTVLLKVEYDYDIFGRRIQEDKWTSATGTVMTKFAYDGPNVWAELDDAEDLQTRYVRPDGIDALAARVDSTPAVAWYLVDRLGSVIGLTNSSGVVQDRIYYDGFGRITSETNAAYGGRLKFTGKDFDTDAGLQHNWTRYYDPATGRWTTIDFIRFRAGDLNLYRYVQNSATNRRDPFGLFDLDDLVDKQGRVYSPDASFYFDTRFSSFNPKYGLGKIHGPDLSNETSAAIASVSLKDWTCDELLKWMWLSVKSLAYRYAEAQAKEGLIEGHTDLAIKNHWRRFAAEAAFHARLEMEYLTRKDCKGGARTQLPQYIQDAITAKRIEKKADTSTSKTTNADATSGNSTNISVGDAWYTSAEFWGRLGEGALVIGGLILTVYSGGALKKQGVKMLLTGLAGLGITLGSVPRLAAREIVRTSKIIVSRSAVDPAVPAIDPAVLRMQQHWDTISKDRKAIEIDIIRFRRSVAFLRQTHQDLDYERYPRQYLEFELEKRMLRNLEKRYTDLGFKLSEIPDKLPSEIQHGK